MQSETIGKLAEAMAIAQGKMKNPQFDQTNPAFKSKFASLAAVRNEVIARYSEQGITVAQDLTTNSEGVACTTVLMHKSGEFMSFGPFVVPLAKRDAWSVAGAATYAKRISLQGVAVVVGDQDDDGATAQETHRGDRSGRPDTSGVDMEQAGEYGQSMLYILQDKDADRAFKLHTELCQDAAMYTAAMDSFKRLCTLNNITYPRDKWDSLVKLHTTAAKGKAA